MTQLIRTGLFFVLLMVVALRPLVVERYDSSPPAVTEALAQLDDASPLRTLVFDLLILITALGWAISHAIQRSPPYRRTGLEWGAILLIVASVISCIAAGHKRLAINASIDWLCLPVAAIVLAQLARNPWHRRLLLAVVLASAWAQAVQCFDQYFVGFHDTWEHYQNIKAGFWAQQGVALDSPTVALFEHRIQAREASGFFPHSGVAGSYLVLCAMASLGFTIDRFRQVRRGAGWIAMGAGVFGTALLFGAVVLTGSTGACVSAGVGFALWIVVVLCRRWIAAHRTKALWLGGGLALGVCLAVVGHGLYHGSLPRGSLGFRWRYWTASAHLIADHGLTGVGRENFGRRYLQYKTIDSPEEIATPHNLFVQATAEWGATGLMGVLAMLVGGLSMVAGRRRSQAPCDSGSIIPQPRGSPVRWAVLLGGGIVAVRYPLLGTTDPSFVYLMTVMVGMPWLMGFLCYAAPPLQPDGYETSADRSTYTGVAIGLFAFLLHDLINFAMFVPGTAVTFFALLAYCFSQRTASKIEQPEDNPSPSDELRATQTKNPGNQARKARGASNPSAVRDWIVWMPAAIFTVALLTVIATGIVPVARSVHFMNQTRGLPPAIGGVPMTRQPAYTAFERAAAADRLDPYPLLEQARWLVTQAADPAEPISPTDRDEALSAALNALRQAARRDPWSTKYHRFAMQVHQMRAQGSGDSDDLLGAIEAAKAVLKRYPLNPPGLIDLADCELAAGQAMSNAALLRESISHYRRALDLDDARPEWEVLRRFSQTRRAAVEVRMDSARRSLEAMGKQ